MEILLFLLMAGAVFVYFKYRTGANISLDSKEVITRGRGRSEAQKQALRYFFNNGSLHAKVSDEAYDALVSARVRSLEAGAKTKVMAKMNLDESQCKEIEPVCFKGYHVDSIRIFSKRGSDGKLRSSAYQISWLFFSATQVYLYQYTFHMDEDRRSETAEEYFYRDITNFSTVSDTEEKSYWDARQTKTLLGNKSYNRFRITVPGKEFYCSLEQNEYTERAIQGMRTKLREKKNS
ncbi:MAG: hypothetical protein LBJ23_00695 [Tannerella sp.]|jgi:hypothetical protein|nr:hypothetical protein [Tannerella sp.]